MQINIKTSGENQTIVTQLTKKLRACLNFI